MSKLFESVSCSRCGGSGMYGPLSVMAGKCFKCLGAGDILTKRGAAAQAYLNGLREVAAADLNVGDKYLLEGIPGFSRSVWVEVASVEVEGDRVTLVDAKHGQRHGFEATRRVRKAQTAEANEALRAQALLYQDSLTKAGSPRKRAA